MNYKRYAWARTHDGWWTFAEANAIAELGGPTNILEQKTFWVGTEAGMLVFEAYNGHRRKYEDEGRGLLSHIEGPICGRLRWGFNRALDLRESQREVYERDTRRIAGVNVDGSFWYLSLSLPGSPTWRNLPTRRVDEDPPPAAGVQQ